MAVLMLEPAGNRSSVLQEPIAAERTDVLSVHTLGQKLLQCWNRGFFNVALAAAAALTAVPKCTVGRSDSG